MGKKGLAINKRIKNMRHTHIRFFISVTLVWKLSFDRDIITPILKRFEAIELSYSPGSTHQWQGVAANEKPEGRPRPEPQMVVFVLALHIRALKRCGQGCRAETKEPIVWRTTQHDASF